MSVTIVLSAERSRPISGAITPSRFHGLDAWRGILLALGVLVHAASLFVAPNTPSAFTWIVYISHLFRMEAFFAVAGFLGWMSQAKGRDSFLPRRTLQLSVPMITMLFVIAPIVRSLTSSSGAEVSPFDLGHLWFLVTLITVTLAFAHIDRWIDIDRHVHRLGSCGAPMVTVTIVAALCVVQLATLALLTILQQRGWIGSGHTVGYTLVRSPYYLLFYMSGLLLGRNSGYLAQLQDSKAIHVGPLALVLALAAVSTNPIWFLGTDASRIQEILRNAMISIVAAPMALTILLSGTRASGANATVRRLADSAFSIYLLHYGVVLVCGSMLVGVNVDDGVKFALVSVLALALPYAFHRLLIRRFAWVNFVLNGMPLPEQPASSRTSWILGTSKPT